MDEDAGYFLFHGSIPPQKKKRIEYRLCEGNNCLAFLKASTSKSSCDYLFTGNRDWTLKRWAIEDGDPTPSGEFQSHHDWVTDAMIIDDNILVSCSQDQTMKTWNCLSNGGVCTESVRKHSDYVTCLAGSENNKKIVASGGFGGEIFIWDIETGLSPIVKNSLAAKGHKASVYALAMNDVGTMLVSGGIEQVIRVWDPRTGSKNMKLRGHTDNIRALLIDGDGRYCISGSSDSTIRLWDLGQRRCVDSYAVHTGSVWALAGASSFTHFYSGGRDGLVYFSNLSTKKSVLVCDNKHPVLQLALQDDTIWVATTDSSVYGHCPVEIMNVAEPLWEIVSPGLMKKTLQSGTDDYIPSTGNMVLFNYCMSALNGEVIESTFVGDGGDGPVRMVLDETKMLLGFVKSLCSMSINEISLVFV